MAAGAREAGTDLHDVLAEFTRRHPTGHLPEGAAREFSSWRGKNFADRLEIPAFRAFRWPRMAAIFPAFVEWEAGRRGAARQIDAEVRGKLEIPLADRSIFHLTAIADRIERRMDGRVHIIDYKSGRVPTSKEIDAGFAPQLVLEAAMVAKGGFEAFARGTAVDEAFICSSAIAGRTSR